MGFLARRCETSAAAESDDPAIPVSGLPSPPGGPTPATQKDQTIILFNGIQIYGDNFGILQPALQWGSSAAGGGPYWSIASWYVTSKGQAFHTPLVTVAIGQLLLGLMTLLGKSGTKFIYDCEFRGIPGTTLPVQNITELLWCNETLEAYTLTQCSDYPSTDHTAFPRDQHANGQPLSDFDVGAGKRSHRLRTTHRGSE